MATIKSRRLPKHNKLWLARKRLGLGQKQLASLLNHHTADQVSRYERGERVPTLRVALELEIALRTPLRVLFSDLYEELQQEISTKIRASQMLTALYGEDQVEEKSSSEFCTTAELLRQPHPPLLDRLKVRDHVTELAKKLAVL